MPNLQPQKIRENGRRAKRLPEPKSSDWVGLWSVSLGLAALPVASIVYFAGRNNIGASFILCGTAAMIALIMRAGANPNV